MTIRHSRYKVFLVCIIQVMFFNMLGQNLPVVEPGNNANALKNKLDFKQSSYTGYTRKHWLEVTEKIILGALGTFNPLTGLPNPPMIVGDVAFDAIRYRNVQEEGKRGLERMLMAVIIYTKATGKDHISGHKGSISAPFIKAIIEGTDPNNKKYWGDPIANDQVGSVFAMAAYIEPARYWNPLTTIQKKNLLLYLQKQTYNPTYNNNHYYFHMIACALLEKNGYYANREHLMKMSERLMGWYRGDGWFLDGNNRGFDYYNLWGFQLFNHVLYKYDAKWKEAFGKNIEKSTAQFLETLPYLYGRDGGPIPWGRSLSYRFAGNAALAWAILDGTSTLNPGQSRRIASGCLKYFVDHGCFGENDLLNIGYWGSNAAVAEPYLWYGDPYWACQGLAYLLIPETDPFWTSQEEPIPADGTGGKKMVSGAQFVSRISSIDGEARLFPIGQPWAQDHKNWQTWAKYDQHSYSSYLGFCIQGEGSDSNGAGRTGYSYDGIKWQYRERAKPIQIEANHIISTYALNSDENQKDEIPYYNRDELTTHTLIGNDGEVHIFWHNNPDPIYLYLGGYGISIPFDNNFKENRTETGIRIKGNNYGSLLQFITGEKGKLDITVLQHSEGWQHAHLFGGNGAFPFWTSNQAVAPNVPIAFYVNGVKGREINEAKVEVESNPGVLKIKFEEKTFEIKVPF